MSEQFYTILTNTGKAKIANSLQTGKKLDLVKMKIGDGNGKYYEPLESQDDLVHKVYECDIASVELDENNSNWITITGVIPPNVGGFNINEVGIFDKDNSLISIGKYPQTYKPLASDGSTKELHIRMTLEVTNASSVELKADPTFILATKQDILKLKEKVDINTTQLSHIVNSKAEKIDLQSTNNELTTQKTMIDTLVKSADKSYYEKTSSGVTGALLIVTDNATTGQINLESVTPVADGYVAKVGDYVRLVYGIASGNTELIDIRNGADGINYDTAGKSIRGQLKKIDSKNNSMVDFNTSIYPSDIIVGDFISLKDANNAPLTINKKVKNLLPLTKENLKKTLNWFSWTSDTEFNGDGISYKVNDNGSITVNGTASKDIHIAFCKIENLDPNKTYSCSDDNGGSAKVYNTSFVFERNDEDRGRLDSYDQIKTAQWIDKITVWLSIKSGEILNNVILKPMIEEGKIVHDYVPFTNIKLVACKNNLLSFENKVIKQNGITVTLGNNNIIHAVGTASDDTTIFLKKFEAPTYNYTCFENGGKTTNSTFYIEFEGGYYDKARESLNSYNTGEKAFASRVNQVMIYFIIKRGVKLNEMLQPMISRGVEKYETYYGNDILITNSSLFPNKSLATFKECTNIFGTDGAELEISYLKDLDIDIKKISDDIDILNNVAIDNSLYEDFTGNIITISQHDTNYFKIKNTLIGTKVIVCRNNLLKLLEKTIKVNGVTITVNNDSTVSLKGTSTSSIWTGISDIILPPFTYACIEGTGLTKNKNFNIQFYGSYNNQDRGHLDSNGNEHQFSAPVDKIGVVVNIQAGVTVDVTLKPMISLNAMDYETYEGREISATDLTMTNLELFEGVNNIFATDKSTIKIGVLKNTTNEINDMKKALKTNTVNYNKVPVVTTMNGKRKSINEDSQGILKLYEINEKAVGSSKYNGNTYVVDYFGTTLKCIDPNGAIIFTKTINKAPIYNFNKVKNSNNEVRFTYGLGEGNRIDGVVGFDPQKWYIVDENFDPIKQQIALKSHGSAVEGMGCDNHVFHYIDDNHYIITGYLPHIADDIPNLQGKYKVVNCVIQEIKNDEVIFHWESKDYPELYSLSLENNNYASAPESGTIYNDYCHINAIDIDTDNNYIISCRNIGIMKLNRSNGNILWLFGRGGRIDFKNMTSADCGYLQHDIRIQKDKSITIFDNSGCGTDNSRVCRYWLDEKSMTMTKFKEYKTHRPRSMFMGSAILLDDDTETFLICYGGKLGILFEEINFSTGETNFTLYAESKTGCAYNALRDINEVKY